MESSTKNIVQTVVAVILGGLAVYLFLGQSQSGPQKTETSMPSREESAGEHVFLNEADVKWVPAPAALPKGARIAVIEGDPSKAGPFTMRLELPANYTIAPHFHPAIEHVTVLSGTFYIGQGSTFNETDLKGLSTGGFAVMQPGMHHFARTKNTGAVLQLHAIGPWGLSYVNPADDPRQAE